MSIASKVLWGEGLFLRPQHFQQQDRYHEGRLHRTVSALQPFLWGVAALEWDRQSLRNGKLKLEMLSLIFRDGEPFDAPDADALPPPIDLTALPPALQQVTYHAALPIMTGDGVNCSPAGTYHAGARFTQADRDTADLFTQSMGAQVAYLKKAVRLMADTEALGSYESLPLIRLRRVVSGGFEADPAFIPASLSIGATPRLKTMLDHLVEALQAKAEALLGHHREPSKNVIEFRSGDVSSFWLLHTVSTAAATLMHYVRHPALHPERLFEAMLGLAGALMSYSKHYTLDALPAYDHGQPGPCFAELYHIIRELIDTVISSKYFSIALSEAKPSYHLGKLDAGQIDQKTTLYLAIRAAMPATN